MSFKDDFNEIMIFSGGYYVLDAEIPKHIFIEEIKREYGHSVLEDEICEKWVRFGFVPGWREDFDGPIWYIQDHYQKGCKKIWCWRRKNMRFI